MVVENKRQKKLPPPRPPPPYKSPVRSPDREDAPVAIPRSQTVSGDRPTRKPKLSTLNAGIPTGSPPIERKSADPVPPPRRKKQRSPGVYPGSGPTSPVKEAFGLDKQYPLQSVQGASRESKDFINQPKMPHTTVDTEPKDSQGTNEKENGQQRVRLPTRGVQSSKRKEAQKVAKAKVSCKLCT